MKIEELIDNASKARTLERMNTSSQLSLIELILHLKGVTDKAKNVVFDGGEYCPIAIDSWRGSYADLSLHYKLYEVVRREEIKTVAEWIETLEKVIGQTFEGYKGGDYVMGKTTPIWVANWGEPYGFRSNEQFWYQAVVGVEETDKHVSLVTDLMDF